MAGRGARALSEFYRELDAIPAAAQHELADKLGKIGRDILAAQQQAVPKDTGVLQGALTSRLVTDELKVKVGLLGGGSNLFGRKGMSLAGAPFYGRYVEFGRSAQTANVTRKMKSRVLKGNNRKGNNRRVLFVGDAARLRRRGPNKGTPVGSAYKLRVKARGKRPFIGQPDLEQIAERSLSSFWVDVLERTSAA